MTNTYASPHDWSALDEGIHQFISEGTLAASTLASYEKSWKVFSAFCTRRGFEPLGAPIEAYEALVAAFYTGNVSGSPSKHDHRDRDLPWSEGSTGVLLAAIAHEHRIKGLTAAHQDPVHASRFDELYRGFLRKSAGQRPPTKQSRPLLRDEVRALIRTQFTVSDRLRSRAVMAFLALDLQLDWNDLRCLRVADVDLRSFDSVRLRVRGRACPIKIDCTCPVRDREVVSPEDLVTRVCVACMVRELAATRLVSADARLCVLKRVHWDTFRANVHTAWNMVVATPSGGLRVVEIEADEWSRRGMRLGILWFAEETIPLHATVARMVMSWSLGLRSLDEPSRLTIGDVSLVEGLAVAVHLGSSKTDQSGDGVQLRMPAPTSVHDVAAPVAQWLAVRTTMSGDKGSPLFCAYTSWAVPQTAVTPGPMSVGNYWRDVQSQMGLVGLTMHSTRTGYAVTAKEDGHDLLDIKDGLRVARAEAAVHYSRQAGGLTSATSVLHAAVGTSVG